MRRVLHVLSQRPSLTGSGVTLDSLVRHAASAGWRQHVVVGVPAADPRPLVGGLEPGEVSALLFDRAPLDFHVPGMSDVMPYPSTRFSEMTAGQLSAYRRAWRSHLSTAIEAFRPDVIHSHHLWIVSAMLKEVAPGVPVVTQCHATGLRQMRLCPHLADDVRRGCSRNDRFLALHGGDAESIVRSLDIAGDRVEIVGAGYRDDLFHTEGRGRVDLPRLVYVGKYSASKGLPWLLDAVERLRNEWTGLELHVVGSGSGAEADSLAERMRAMAPTVTLHGTLSQERLAGVLRRCDVCVLPSFYEGVPLVLVEALACGCLPVATDLPGVRDELAPHLGDSLIRIPTPRMKGVDTPDERDLPRFVDDLCAAIGDALTRRRSEPGFRAPASALERFTWSAVFRRVEVVWKGGHSAFTYRN